MKSDVWMDGVQTTWIVLRGLLFPSQDRRDPEPILFMQRNEANEQTQLSTSLFSSLSFPTTLFSSCIATHPSLVLVHTLILTGAGGREEEDMYGGYEV